MNNTPKELPEEAWDNRDLGATESFANKVSAEHEKKLDDKLNLQIISIRLQKDLIDEIKQLARESGLGYQPYMRQVLSHHIRDEKIKRAKQTEYAQTAKSSG